MFKCELMCVRDPSRIPRPSYRMSGLGAGPIRHPSLSHFWTIGCSLMADSRSVPLGTRSAASRTTAWPSTPIMTTPIGVSHQLGGSAEEAMAINETPANTHAPTHAVIRTNL